MDYKTYKQQLMDKLELTDNEALEIVKALELMSLIGKAMFDELKLSQTL